MEKNAWEVAKQVTALVDDDPGPAKDYFNCYTSTTMQMLKQGQTPQNNLFLDTTSLRRCSRLQPMYLW